MKATARAFCIAVLTIAPLIGIGAQVLPSVAAYGLSSNDVGENVSRTVNDLVFSFVKELKSYRIIDLRNEPPPRDLAVPEGADYIFYGSLVSQSDGTKLELVLKGGPQRVTRLISRIYENSNIILLESRMLVRDLFDTSVALPDAELPKARQEGAVVTDTTRDSPSLGPVTDLDSLAGSWRGESGVEKVLILRGGRGVAVLSSGVSIPLELYLSNGTLVVRQKGPSNLRQFIDLPDPVARQAVSAAPPLEWYLMESQDQKTLGGTKKTVFIKNDGKNILTMESVSIEVVWSRD
jgi:hypothetical protein